LRTVISSFYAGVEAASTSRLVTRNAISIIFPLPISYTEKIRQVEGVRMVSYGNWFGGIYINEKNFFPNFCVEPRTYLALYPEFILEEKQKKAAEKAAAKVKPAKKAEKAEKAETGKPEKKSSRKAEKAEEAKEEKPAKKTSSKKKEK